MPGKRDSSGRFVGKGGPKPAGPKVPKAEKPTRAAYKGGFSAGGAEIAIDFEKLGPELQKRGPAILKAVNRGALSGANFGRAVLVRATPTNTGKLRNAWKVSRKPDLEIYNEAPYAGIVESGARPHAVSKAGMVSLQRWARRKLGASPKEAAGIAFAIAVKLKKFGQKPTYFVRNQLPKIAAVTRREITRELAKTGSKPAKKGGK